MAVIPVREIREGTSESRQTLENVDTFVVSLCSGSFVRVPPWFSIGGARELARFKNTRHVLVVQNGDVRGLVDENTLATAPLSDVVTRWCRQTSLRVAPETGWRDALDLMRKANSDWLLVGAENFVVGIVLRAELEEAEAAGG